jgi:hypothetical protein
MAAATKKEKKRRSLPLEGGASSGHTTNLKKSILETFDIYAVASIEMYKFTLASGAPKVLHYVKSYLHWRS